MANQEQFERLKQGVEGWNTWRARSPEVRIDLCDTNLNSADLNSTDLSRANLQNADLQNADLRSANLSDANLSNADLQNANLIGADLHFANCCDANFCDANLCDANLSNANLCGANLCGANLRISNCCDANLSNTNLCGVNLSGANLRSANLRDANLSRANLHFANLRSANLCFAKLYWACLNEAHLQNADLQNADLSEAQLTNAVVELTTFGNVDLRTIKGLETIKHSGPSTVGIDTIYRSHGHIPKVFLQRAGIPESFIEYMDALIGASKPIEYATCFISYSDQDRLFAEKIYNHLQSKNVRCWYAPHSLKIGDRIRPIIDQAIHAQDKLLLVLSEHSITSQWVEFEVERALARERKEQRDVIFPIRIESITNENTAWVNLLKDTRHIGDFEQWEHEEQYQTALTRLLSDLQKSTEREQ